MSGFTLTARSQEGYNATVARVRDLLADAGFGVLTEIDIKATLKTKLDVDVPPQVILGACRPQLAHRARLGGPGARHRAVLGAQAAACTAARRCAHRGGDPAQLPQQDAASRSAAHA